MKSLKMYFVIEIFVFLFTRIAGVLENHHDDSSNWLTGEILCSIFVLSTWKCWIEKGKFWK